jgi:hypothetical protein
LRSGADHSELEVAKSRLLGSLNPGAVASDPLIGVGDPWVQEKSTPLADAARWHLPDTPSFQEAAGHIDRSGTVNLRTCPQNASLTGDRPISHAQPAFIGGYPQIAGPGMDVLPVLSCDPWLPHSESRHRVDPLAEDQQTSTLAPLVVSKGCTARDEVPAYRAYQEFLQQNPDWRDDYYGDRLVIQVITPSLFEPTVWLADPLAAGAFDSWFEKYWLPFDSPPPGLPWQEQPSPGPGQTPDQALPCLPTDPLSSDAPGSDVSRTDPLYLAFSNFLEKNPGWLTDKAGEIGTCAITQSRNVASIWLRDSREALAFDAWYALQHSLGLDQPIGPSEEDPIVSPLDSGERDSAVAGPWLPSPCPARPILNTTAPNPNSDASPSFGSASFFLVSSPDFNVAQAPVVPPLVGPLSALLGLSRPDLQQAEDRVFRFFDDPMSFRAPRKIPTPIALVRI